MCTFFCSPSTYLDFNWQTYSYLCRFSILWTTNVLCNISSKEERNKIRCVLSIFSLSLDYEYFLYVSNYLDTRLGVILMIYLIISGSLERGGGGCPPPPPPVFRDFYLICQKFTPKMLKIGLFWVFRPPSFCIAPSVFKTVYRPCHNLTMY